VGNESVAAIMRLEGGLRGCLPAGVVTSVCIVSASRTTLVFARLVCTHTSFPSGETRSIHRWLPAGKLTV
jgi:hypothetical protein